MKHLSTLVVKWFTKSDEAHSVFHKP